MFLYREKELNTLSIDGNVIVYGKRRVGKTSLIKEYIQSSGKTYYYFECLKTSLEENLYYMVNDCYCCVIGSSNCAIARDIKNEEKKPQSTASD